MENNKLYTSAVLVFLLLSFCACKTPEAATKTESTYTPASFGNNMDTTNTGRLTWRAYFKDQHLIALIDTALKNNQELNITLQEIEIGKNEVKARTGEYLPFVNIVAGAGMDKEGRYTRHGAVDETLDIKEETPFPEPLPDYMFGAFASWEVDIWKKLRNSKKAAVAEYLATVEGKHFMVTNLIAEIADAYYELVTLDNLLDLIEQNVDIQTHVLQTVKLQKEAARVTQLAVNRFEAQLLNTKNLQYDLHQKITEAENRIHFLTGKFPSGILRDSQAFNTVVFDAVYAGLPAQLLENRPDIRQSELELMASKLDVKVAKARFYPSLSISAGIGYQAFSPSYLVKPESLLYSLGGELLAPLINRNAIKATYNTANAKQIQAVYEYERTILNAYIEVVNSLSRIDNYAKSYETKSKEVAILSNSITISNTLFRSARADYMEVLLTQREALDSKIELLEIKMKQMHAKVAMYKALGGGWN
jgi:NodT family efflux transporter outer membrane factor (OMF) lipoprotein